MRHKQCLHLPPLADILLERLCHWPQGTGTEQMSMVIQPDSALTLCLACVLNISMPFVGGDIYVAEEGK